MKRILKFGLNEYGVSKVYTKNSPTILSVGADKKEQVSVWLEAEEGTSHVTVFQSVFTGGEVPYDDNAIAVYIGTAHVFKNELIVHVYQWVSNDVLARRANV